MPTTRVLHLSDLHLGAGDDEAIERGAPVLIERFRPELVIASGDLSHRGRPDQLARASRFLQSLERPVLAVPGNHDIPYTFPGPPPPDPPPGGATRRRTRAPSPH